MVSTDDTSATTRLFLPAIVCKACSTPCSSSVLYSINRPSQRKCTWNAPTKIEFRGRTRIGVSVYLGINNEQKKLKLFFTEKKVFYRNPKMSLFQVLTAAELSGRSLGQLPCYMDCSAAAEISGRRPPGSLVVWII
jgi:hypothetical protein